MIILNPGISATLNLHARDMLSIATRDSVLMETLTSTGAVASAVIISGDRTIGPASEGKVRLTAFGGDCHYLVTSATTTVHAAFDTAGGLAGLVAGDVAVPFGLTNPRKPAVFIGDSLTDVASGRATGHFAGQTYWYTTTVTGTNIGGATWVSRAMADSRTPTATGGTLETDGNGRLRWIVTGDAPGAYVDVTTGGWFLLHSGTTDATRGPILVHVRGATTPPGAATAAVSFAGNPTLVDWDTRGYAAWLAGMLGDTFSDYRIYGMSGANSADILKHAPQALAHDAEAVFILMGVNDAPTTAAAAQASLANIKAVIDLAAARARRVYVGDIFPNPSATQTVQRFLALVSAGVREYCRTKQGCVFWSAYHQLFHPNAATITSAANARTGAYQTDNLHMMPFGAYLAAAAALPYVQADYPSERQRKAVLDTWDATLGVGAWNANPTLRGIAGGVTAANGITGTAPDSWSLSRSGANQLCTTSFDPAPDGGIDFWSMDVSGATAGEYHQLSQSVTLPAGVAVGDYVRLTGEVLIGATGGAGLAVTTMHAGSNGNLQLAYLLRTDRNIATFTTEKPVLQLTSEPMRLLSGVTSFTLHFRVGGAAGGGTGKIGVRNFRIEKCAGPIFP